MHWHESIRLLSETIVSADHIATYDLVTVDANTSVADAVSMLEVAGVEIAPLNDRRCHRYVDLQMLRAGSGTAGDNARSIPPNLIVAASTPLGALIPEFLNERHFFVLRHTSVDGIVARADLQLPIVAMTVLGVIVTFEQALTQIVLAELGPNWIKALSAEQQRRLHGIHQSRASHNVDIGLEECLTLPQRLTLLHRAPTSRACLGFGSIGELKHFTRQIVGLRNVVAHGGGLLSVRKDPCDAIRIFTRAREVTAMAVQLAVGSQPAQR